MKTVIVAEGAFDHAIVKQLLASRPDFVTGAVAALEAQGASSAVSLARSFLAVKNQPTALLLDADVDEPDKIQERKEQLEQLLGLAAVRDLWEVCLFVPTIEIIFFQTPGILEALGLRTPTPDEYARARHEPKNVLSSLALAAGLRTQMDLIPRFPGANWESVWTRDPFTQLHGFLRKHLARKP